MLLAKKYRAARTIIAIKRGGCFAEIFKIAEAEVGISALVEALSEADDWYWAYKGLCHVAEISKEQKKKLVATIVAAQDAYGAALTLRDVWDVTQEDRAQLEKIYRVAA